MDKVAALSHTVQLSWLNIWKEKKNKENATFLLWPKKCFLEGGELRASLVNLHCNFLGMLDGDSEGEITFQGAPLSHF